MATRNEQRLAREAREADVRRAKEKARADGLAGAIREHYRQVHAGNWGWDDELWATVGLEADASVIG